MEFELYQKAKAWTRQSRRSARGKSLENIKLSVEAKVAAAVAAGFIALTAAAIGQAGSAAQSGGPNNYGPTDSRCVNTHTSE